MRPCRTSASTDALVSAAQLRRDSQATGRRSFLITEENSIGMKRIGLMAGVVVLAVSILGTALLTRDDDAQAQGLKAPILVLEVASWAEDNAKPAAWQWQAFDDGSLHVAFFPDACQKIALPAGITATYADDQGVNTTAAGPGEPVNMCEAVFSRANG